jgi:putative transposase
MLDGWRMRWSSPGNSEVVRLAFALDCHDREAISWVATTAGISGEMIRDMMVRCVEQRFGALVQRDAGSWGRWPSCG